MFKYFAARSASWGQTGGKVPPRFPQGSAKVSPKVPPRFSKFRGVSASVAQIRLSLQRFRGRFRQGSTKVPPKSPSFLVSLVLWGRSVLASSWPAKRFPGRFRQAFTRLLGQIHFVSRKGCAEGSPITSLQLCLPVPLIFFACFPNSVISFGVFSHRKGVGKMARLFSFFWQQMVLASHKVLWGVHSVQSLPRFLG